MPLFRRRRFISLFLFLAAPLLFAEQSSSGIPHLTKEQARAAVMAAVDTFNSFRSKDGRLSLLDLKLQSNTIAGILHNLIGTEIGIRAPYWRFIKTGAAGGDLVGEKNEQLELKTSSSLEVKGNQVSHNDRYYLVTHFVLHPDQKKLAVVWVRGGRLLPEDWRRPKGTQWAFLKKENEAKLQACWKDFGELRPAHLKNIGKKRQQLLAEAGIYSVRQVAASSTDLLRKTLRMSDRQVKAVIDQAKELAGGE